MTKQQMTKWKVLKYEMQVYFHNQTRLEKLVKAQVLLSLVPKSLSERSKGLARSQEMQETSQGEQRKNCKEKQSLLGPSDLGTGERPRSSSNMYQKYVVDLRLVIDHYLIPLRAKTSGWPTMFFFF